MLSVGMGYKCCRCVCVERGEDVHGDELMTKVRRRDHEVRDFVEHLAADQAASRTAGQDSRCIDATAYGRGTWNVILGPRVLSNSAKKTPRSCVLGASLESDFPCCWKKPKVPLRNRECNTSAMAGNLQKSSCSCRW